MNNWPNEIRKADIAGLLGEVQDVAGSAIPGVGQAVGVDGLGALVNFFERFAPLLEKISQSMMNMRAFDARQRPQDTVEADAGADEDGWYAGDIYVDDVPADKPVAERGETQQKKPVIQPVSSVGVDPQKVYATILETMAGLPGEMTIGTALQMAREQKELIVQNITTEMAKF
jgi:hypothetical protein